MKKETVLCIERKMLPSSWIQQVSIVPMDLPHFIEKCTRAHFKFIPRSTAEKDPSTKQIIPYVVIQTRDKIKTAIYNRQGSEKRLHDLWSIGIGGHINPEDKKNTRSSFESVLRKGMTRELDEELLKRPENDSLSFIGIISEEETEVGSVHLGAVFRILTSRPDAYAPGPELFEFSWKETKALKQTNLERWSQLALELIKATDYPEA